MPTPRATPPTPVEHEEGELSVEEVAARLGLPVGMLLRRIEAGDVPARRVVTRSGVEYRLRLGDLGVQDSEQPTRARSASPGDQPDDAGDVASAPVEAVSPGETALFTDEAGGGERSGESAEDTGGLFDETPMSMRPGRATVELAFDDELGSAASPRAELAAMHLDPRELVAGLLDRWERTLEQRIHAEQRQRFQAELDSRQAQAKQLQLELERARAEHAAALAERDRVIAERERELSERERWLAEARHLAEDRGRRRGFFRRG